MVVKTDAMPTPEVVPSRMAPSRVVPMGVAPVSVLALSVEFEPLRSTAAVAAMARAMARLLEARSGSRTKSW